MKPLLAVFAIALSAVSLVVTPAVARQPEARVNLMETLPLSSSQIRAILTELGLDPDRDELLAAAKRLEDSAQKYQLAMEVFSSDYAILASKLVAQGHYEEYGRVLDEMFAARELHENTLAKAEDEFFNQLAQLGEVEPDLLLRARFERAVAKSGRIIPLRPEAKVNVVAVFTRLVTPEDAPPITLSADVNDLIESVLRQHMVAWMERSAQREASKIRGIRAGAAIHMQGATFQDQRYVSAVPQYAQAEDAVVELNRRTIAALRTHLAAAPPDRLPPALLERFDDMLDEEAFPELRQDPLLLARSLRRLADSAEKKPNPEAPAAATLLRTAADDLLIRLKPLLKQARHLRSEERKAFVETMMVGSEADRARAKKQTDIASRILNEHLKTIDQLLALADLAPHLTKLRRFRSDCLSMVDGLPGGEAISRHQAAHQAP